MIHGPALRNVLQAKEEMNVEDIGVGFHRAQDASAIAPVALHDFGVEVRHLGLGGLHEGDGLFHHRGVLEVAEHTTEFLVEVVVLGRELSVQLVADGLYLIAFRHAATAHDDAVGAQEGKLAHFVEFVEIDLQEALHARGEAALEVTAGEAEQGVDGSQISFLVLPLDRDAGGIAQVVVVVVEVGPSGCQSLGVGMTVEGLQHVTRLAGLGVFAGGVQLGQFGRSRTLVGHAVKRGLSASSTDAKVHVAVRADIDVGEGERAFRV